MRYCWLIVLFCGLMGGEIAAQAIDTFSQPNLFYVAKPMFKKKNTVAYYENYLKEKATFGPQDTIYGVLYAGLTQPYWLSEDEKGKYIIVDYWIGGQAPVGIQHYLQPMQTADLKLPRALDELASKLIKRSSFYYFKWAANPHIYDVENKLSLYQMIYDNYDRETIFDGMTFQYSLGGGIDHGTCFIDFSSGKGVYADILAIMEERVALESKMKVAQTKQNKLEKDVAPLSLTEFQEWLELRQNSKENVKTLEFELFKKQESTKNAVNTLPADLPQDIRKDFQALYTIDMSIVAKDNPAQKNKNLKRREKLANKLKMSSLAATHYATYAQEANSLLALCKNIDNQKQQVSQRQYVFMRQMHKFKEMQRLHESIEGWTKKLEKLH
ncbi:MAG: hypothetical protein GY810_20090 [Aureispira sp.]|nr:hypothetical protein [Aureispira sp.]